ncbi:GNAT family N-acetyltransferase [Pseudomonas sp. LRF_L74]|uniref:GNAT family N-acetyltransferase n=1 Tax=Pseudomonas sp. LRF_L74 TaxID=3369422 RepID=UPI003F60C746
MSQVQPEVRELDHGYSRETRALLYRVYRQDPLLAQLLNSGRSGFERRLRATVAELVNWHYAERHPALGLFIDDQMVAAALITPPQRQLGITESWMWRLRMLLRTGLGCTRRIIAYQDALLERLSPGPYHQVLLFGVAPDLSEQNLDPLLFSVLLNWSAREGGARGLLVDCSRLAPSFACEAAGFGKVAELSVGAVVVCLYLHPAPGFE